jgi:hypothetical protein
MDKRQIILQLTDLRHHSTELRPAKSVKGVLNKGLLPDDPASGRLQVTGFKGDGTPILLLPPEWQAAVDRGELEFIIEMPEAGLPQTLSKDAFEVLAKLDKKKQNMGKHNALMNKKRHK